MGRKYPEAPLVEILGTAHHCGRNPAPRKGTERLFLAFLESPSAVLGSDRHLEKRRKQLIDEKEKEARGFEGSNLTPENLDVGHGSGVIHEFNRICHPGKNLLHPVLQPHGLVANGTLEFENHPFSDHEITDWLRIAAKDIVVRADLPRDDLVLGEAEESDLFGYQEGLVVAGEQVLILLQQLEDTLLRVSCLVREELAGMGSGLHKRKKNKTLRRRTEVRILPRNRTP